MPKPGLFVRLTVAFALSVAAFYKVLLDAWTRSFTSGEVSYVWPFGVSAAVLVTGLVLILRRTRGLPLILGIALTTAAVAVADLLTAVYVAFTYA
jgi:hypothetical protein